MASNYTFLRTIADRVILWLHGRRLGLFGDGQASNNNSLVLDGVAVGSTRTGAAPLIAMATSLGSGTGAVTLAGTLVGDVVNLVFDVTDSSDVTGDFESTISVAGQIQQTTALATKTCMFFINPQAAA
jgi:hypothetical protein